MAKFDLQPGVYHVENARVGIVATRFNESIVDRLLAGAMETLARHGIDEAHTTLVRVPGAFEIPLAARRLVGNQALGLEAVITLGAIVRGGTPHFEYVAGACMNGVSSVALESDLPVIFGVLTTDDTEQAMARAGGAEGNKGSQAALAALEMITVFRRMEGAITGR